MTEFQNINNAEFSPDGAQILFGSNGAASDYRIETMNADGSNQTRLTKNDSEIYCRLRSIVYQ